MSDTPRTDALWSSEEAIAALERAASDYAKWLGYSNWRPSMSHVQAAELVALLRALADALRRSEHGYWIDEEEHWLVPIPKVKP